MGQSGVFSEGKMEEEDKNIHWSEPLYLKGAKGIERGKTSGLRETRSQGADPGLAAGWLQAWFPVLCLLMLRRRQLLGLTSAAVGHDGFGGI